MAKLPPDLYADIVKSFFDRKPSQPFEMGRQLGKSRLLGMSFDTANVQSDAGPLTPQAMEIAAADYADIEKRIMAHMTTIPPWGDTTSSAEPAPPLTIQAFLDACKAAEFDPITQRGRFDNHVIAREMFGGMPEHTFCGVPIYTSYAFVLQIEDWSCCRSPARARRRRAKGYPQHVRYVMRADDNVFLMNGGIYCHPMTLRKLSRLIEQQTVSFGFDRGKMPAGIFDPGALVAKDFDVKRYQK